MIFRDAIFNDHKNEPWWFSILRRSSALSLIIILLLFGFSQLKNILLFLNMPNIVIIERKNGVNFPGFVICPESSNPNSIINNNIDPQFSITCGFYSKITGPEVLSESTNNTDNKCSSLISKANNGCLRFQPDDKYIYDENGDNITYSTGKGEFGFNQTFLFFNIKPNINNNIQTEIMPSFYTLHFEDYLLQVENESPIHYSVQNDDNYIFEYNMKLINSGQRNILEYSIDIHRVFSTSLIGLLYPVPDLYTMEIKVNTKNIPRNQRTMETQFVLLPKFPHYLRQEIEKFEYHPISFFSSIGGLHSAIMAFYALLFGMSKIEPWGYLQKGVFKWWSFRRDFKRELANDYNTEPGIPLAENIGEVNLEDRVQSLEYLLKDYYLCSYYMEKLKDTKLNYDNQDDYHEKLEDSLSTRNVNNNNNNRNPPSLTIQVPPPVHHNYLSLISPLSISIIISDDDISSS